MSTNENKGKKAEVTALQAISAEDRKDWISLAFVQAGICVCVPALPIGSVISGSSLYGQQLFQGH